MTRAFGVVQCDTCGAITAPGAPHACHPAPTPTKDPIYCINCAGEISEERLAQRYAKYSCSPECAKEYRGKRARRKMAKRRGCANCGRPSTPEEWAQFKKWRKSIATAAVTNETTA